MKNFNYIQTSDFLLRVGATAEEVFRRKLRITTLINIGNTIYRLSNKNPEVIANHLKMAFISLNTPSIQEELIKLNYNVLTKENKLRSFWSIISIINTYRPHPKLVSLFGIQVWDTIKYLIKYK